MFEKRRAEMDVEDMQGRSVKPYVGSQTTTRQAAATLQIVVTTDLYRKTAQDDISVLAAIQFTGLSEGKVIAQLVDDKTQMVAQNFLQGNDIGVYFSEYLDNTIRPYAAIQSTAFMNVVSYDSQSLKTGGQDPPAQNTTIIELAHSCHCREASILMALP